MHKPLLVVVSALLFALSAFAARVCEEGAVTLAGVDAEGNLSPEQEGEVHCKECVNTRNGKYTLKCAGTVGNESGKSQKYENPSEVFEEIDKVIYRVKANGSAKLTAKGFDEEL